VIRTTAFVLAISFLPEVTVLAAEADPKAAAKTHFERGVAAFNENRLAEAASEFSSAYDLTHAFKILYNVGQVNAALGDAVAAVDAYEKYLAQGGNAIPSERKQAVQAELEKQRDRIGTVTLQVEPEGAEIRVDGKLVGKAPLSEALRLTEGKREVVVIASGYDAGVRELKVAPKSQMEIEIKLDKVSGKNDNGPTVASEPQMPAPSPITSNPSPATHAVPANSSAPSVGSGPASSNNVQRTTGYVVGAVGIGTASTGLILALTSASRASSAQSSMTNATSGTNWDSAKRDYDSAKSSNRLGWACLGLGAAALASGFVLIATAPTTKASTAWAVTPWKTAHAGGVMAETEF